MLKTFISRVRRNHGLEHATIHVLSQRYKNEFSAQGNANHRGFYLNIYGNIPAGEIEAAVYEAFRRMRGGEHGLAVHPNCGTALLTTAAMTTLATQAAFSMEQKRQGDQHTSLSVLINGLPSAILAATLALITSRPLGLYLQARFTTQGDLEGLQIVRIRTLEPSLTARFFQVLLGVSQAQARSYFIETAG